MVYMYTAYKVIAAYLVDLLVGDPRSLPHPVVIIGKLIDFLEKYLRKFIAPILGIRISGVLLTTITVGLTYVVMWSMVEGAQRINYWFGTVISIWFLSTTIAVKGLGSAGLEIYNLLKEGNIAEARKKVGWIVGRDTNNLDEGEISRATVETVAENIVDGIVAPLFFGFIGGAPLAMAYKAVNTLDSMVGYKNETYQKLGWASAKFDDLCNFIPARITGILLLLTALLLGKPVTRAVRIIIRDSAGHPSPNSGIPEAAVAGALGIRLGGFNYYGGIKSFRAYMGDPINELDKGHILETVRIMKITTFLALTTGILAYYLIFLLLN